MLTVTIATRIKAPIEACFDLSRSIETHIRSTEGTNEAAIEGVTSGLINLGEEVTWEATHFGVRLKLTSRVTVFNHPYHFRDSQVRGPFRRFDHDHFFGIEDGLTLMRDVFDYDSPLGWLGTCADHLFLRSYMARLLSKRARVIKEVAEAVTD